MTEYTVQQISDLAGVSRRTLHYYDEIGLLKPSRIGSNRYRYYNQAALLKLQQVMFYRELGFTLEKIREIMAKPEFDVPTALEQHKLALAREKTRLSKLIRTIENTLEHLKGDKKMSEDKLFNGFSEEQQAEYELQAREEYGDEILDESMNRWGSYSKEKKDAILKEGGEITLRIRDNMDKGADSPEVQQEIENWKNHIGYFYNCTLEILAGLGQMYVDSPDFRKFYTDIHPDLPEFIRDAIIVYVDQRSECCCGTENEKAQ